MFRNRKTSQKPTDEFYASFKASFPHLSSTPATLLGNSRRKSVTVDASIDVTLHSRDFATEEGFQENIHDNNNGAIHDRGHDGVAGGDPIQRPQADEGWRMTPSMLDPDSYTFTSFANQPPGYYTPTPGGTSTLYHSQAGDLHASSFSFGLSTPLSLATSEASISAGQTSISTATSTATALPSYQQPAIAPHHFQNPEPFSLHIPPNQAFVDPSYGHQASGIDHISHVPHSAPAIGDMQLDMDIPEHSPLLSFHGSSFDASAIRPPKVNQQTESHRYHATLHAPTAMIKHADEIPVTYLNKGQAYTLSIVDSAPPQVPLAPVRYRTYVRISFEDEQQRKKPAACWQLWKEGRGTNEAHQRGGRLQAVEFANQGPKAGEQSGMHNVELVSASFDGFVVTWSSATHGPAECAVAVRFNFLSTDFSHSKGVKGIPVRLCAKTEQLSNNMPPSSQDTQSEVYYCRVKLFRDHGAERKLSNDVAHVKRTIEKLKQQITQADSGMQDLAKRKRNSLPSKPSSSKPGKVVKHKRTWSMSSAGSSSGRAALEEDLQHKLATLQDMFTSTRPTSVLYLKGDQHDDPDFRPVTLTGGMPPLVKNETGESSSTWEKISGPTTRTSSIESPTPSSLSVHSGRRSSGFQQLAPPLSANYAGASEWRQLQESGDLQVVQQQHLSSPNADIPIKVSRLQPQADGAVSGWIEALGVNQTYLPPPERTIKPVACFYVQSRTPGELANDKFYRAIYLMRRSLRDFLAGVAAKSDLDSSQAVRAVHVNQTGLNILFDDEMVRELPEGQDMIVEFHALQPRSPVRREWDAGPTDSQTDGDVVAVANSNAVAYELRLYY